jgi:hypothetical protein
MPILERLFCNFVWLAWVVLSVQRRGARPEERPISHDLSSELRQSLIPDRTTLPGW